VTGPRPHSSMWGQYEGDAGPLQNCDYQSKVGWRLLLFKSLFVLTKIIIFMGKSSTIEKTSVFNQKIRLKPGPCL
jgi:hypothetical protein